MQEVKLSDSQICLVYDLETGKQELLLPKVDEDAEVPFTYLVFAAIADALNKENEHISAIVDEFLEKVNKTEESNE